MSRVKSNGGRGESKIGPAHVTGWVQAATATGATLLVLVLSFFYVPHWILTELATPARSGRVWLATAWIAVAFALSCVAALRFTRPSTHAG